MAPVILGAAGADVTLWSGEYTPALTPLGGGQPTVPSPWFWLRIGDIVLVNGPMQLQWNVNQETIGIELPFPPPAPFPMSSDVSGSCIPNQPDSPVLLDLVSIVKAQSGGTDATVALEQAVGGAAISDFAVQFCYRAAPV